MNKVAKKKSREKTYTKLDIEKALNAIKCGNTIRKAAKQFGIPFATLLSRHNGTYSLNTRKGPKTVLSEQEEDELVRWILYMGSKGFPVTKNQVLDSVKIVCIKLKKKTPFIKNRPSQKWFSNFMKRHTELSQRTSQNLTTRRAAVTEKALRNWFKQIHDYLEEKNLLNIDSSRIFNLDESAFLLSPKNNKVIVRKNQKNVYSLCRDDKECLTALITSNAKGETAPGLVLFKGAKVAETIAKLLPNTFAAGRSENGWMTSENFYEYVVNIFYPWCLIKKIQFPIIVYLDGHSSHLTLPLSEFCAEKQIELIAFHPNATHIMQPLDVALFRPLKTAYKDAVTEWRQNHNGNSLTKENFATVLTTALCSLELNKIMPNGFKACGLSPFCADAVNYSKILKEEISSEYSSYKSNDKDQIISYIEQNICAETLESFKKCADSGLWEGPETNKGLFEFWLKAVKRETSITAIHDAIIIPAELAVQEDLSFKLEESDDEENKIIVDGIESSVLEGADNNILNTTDISVERQDNIIITYTDLSTLSTHNNNKLKNIVHCSFDTDASKDLTISSTALFNQELVNQNKENVSNNLKKDNSLALSLHEDKKQIKSEENTSLELRNLLFWPEPDPKKKIESVKKKKELPSIISGPIWIAHEKEKLRQKEEMMAKQQAAKSIREQKKLKRKTAKKIKQEQQEEKRKQKLIQQQRIQEEKMEIKRKRELKLQEKKNKTLRICN